MKERMCVWFEVDTEWKRNKSFPLTLYFNHIWHLSFHRSIIVYKLFQSVFLTLSSFVNAETTNSSSCQWFEINFIVVAVDFFFYLFHILTSPFLFDIWSHTKLPIECVFNFSISVCLFVCFFFHFFAYISSFIKLFFFLSFQTPIYIWYNKIVNKTCFYFFMNSVHSHGALLIVHVYADSVDEISMTFIETIWKDCVW